MIDRVSRYFAIALLFVSSLFLYYKVSLNSDSLFLESLSIDLFTQGGAWSDWKLTPAPAYFPDMLLYFLSYPILPNATSRIFFVSAIQVFLLAFASCWVAKQINPRISKNAITFIILCVSFITIVALKSNMWLYFYSTNNHFASLFLGLLSLGLFIKFFKHPTRWLAVWLVLINAIAYSSTAVFLICFIAPACCLTILFILMLNRNAPGALKLQRKFFYILILLFCSIGFSWLFNTSITNYDPLEGRTTITIERITNSFYNLLQSTVGSFDSKNHYTFSFSLLVLFAFLYLLCYFLRHLKIDFLNSSINWQVCPKEENVSYSLICCGFFLMLIIPINLLGVVFSGGLIDPIAYRYFTFPIALTLILSIVLIDHFYLKNSRFFFIFNFFVIALLLSIEAFLIKHHPLPFGQVNIAPPSIETSVAECLMRIENEGLPLHSGVSTYWLGRGVSHYLKNRQQIVPIFSTGAPYFWMSTLGPFLHPKKYNHISYNFVILYNKLIEPFGLNAENIIKNFPKPSHIYACTGSGTQVWVYQDNSLDKMINTRIRTLLTEVNSQGIFSGAILPGIIGHIEGATRVANEQDKAGFLTYGPYVYLKHGRYKIQLDYTAQSNSNRSIGRLEIGQFSNNLNILHQENLYPGSTHQRLSVIIPVPWDGLKSFEVRTYFSGSGQLRIHSLEITKI